MPAEHLRRLIDRVAPGRSVIQLTAAAGVSENKLAYWLKPSTRLTRMPTMWQLHEIAQIIGATTEDVYHAFRLDVDGAAAVLDGSLPDDEQAMLTAYRQLSDADRARALSILRVLNGE